MPMGKIEDYSKENLEELLEFTNSELNRTKKLMNASGYTKYSPFGSITINYRKQLKLLVKQIKEDLHEDFYEKKQMGDK